MWLAFRQHIDKTQGKTVAAKSNSVVRDLLAVLALRKLCGEMRKARGQPCCLFLTPLIGHPSHSPLFYVIPTLLLLLLVFLS